MLPFEPMGPEDCRTLTSKLLYRGIKKLGWEMRKPPRFGNEAFVWIAYPHTSNWDTLIGAAILMVYDVPFFVIVKETYANPLFKPITKLLHLLPIHRDARAIRKVNEELQRTGAFVVMVPEGTRKKDKGWKSGFHHFARKNSMRIVPSYICYSRKWLVWGDPIEAGNTSADTIELCREFYEREKPVGLHPDQASPIRPFR